MFLRKIRQIVLFFGWKDFTADGQITEHKVTEEMKNLEASEAVFQIASDNFLCGGGYPWNKVWNAEKNKAGVWKYCEVYK